MQDSERFTAQHRATVLRQLRVRKRLEPLFGWRLSACYQRLRLYYRRWQYGLAFAAPVWRALKGDPYTAWVREENRLLASAQAYAKQLTLFKRCPTISILTQVREPHLPWLEQCLASLRTQFYVHWEVWICGVNLQTPLHSWLEQYQTRDARIKLLPPSTPHEEVAALNRALRLAAGEFIALLDQHDTLAPQALYEIIRRAQEDSGDVFYSDEDEIDDNGVRSAPFFKPDWSPDLCLSSLYACHLGVYRRSLVEAVGGFRAGFAEDAVSREYDLLLRCKEQAHGIIHIPQVLYHKRTLRRDTLSGHLSITPGNQGVSLQTINPTHVSTKHVLQHALTRRGVAAEVDDGPLPCTFRVRRHLNGVPLVTIIIPTRDRLNLLRRCLESIERRTTYQPYEILLIDNGSREPRTLTYLASLPYRVIRDNAPFNFARLNNRAVTLAQGEQLVFLNNDIEVITPQWLEALLEHSQRQEVGAVGAQLLYADGTIQHAGVVLGVRGVAGHAHKYLPVSDLGYQGFPHLVRNYSAVTAACLMTRKAIYEEVGGMDERLAVTFNDVDFCLRLRERGYLIVYTPFARLYHHESQSRWSQPPHDEEVQYMLDRWGALLANDPYYNPHLTLKREDFGFDLGRARRLSAWN